MTPKPALAEPGTQIRLPESILTEAREEASGVGIPVEVLVAALLQVFRDADKSVKAELAKHLESLRNPGRD